MHTNEMKPHTTYPCDLIQPHQTATPNAKCFGGIPLVQKHARLLLCDILQ